MGRKILGVDPGTTGALAFLGIDGVLVELEDMPVIGNKVNAPLLTNLILGYGPIHIAVVEDVHAFPGQGVNSVWTFALAHGTVLGVLGALEIPTVFVQPNVWKKRWGLIRKEKDESRGPAIRTWPSHANSFKRKSDHNRADACLMAKGWLLDNPGPIAGKSKRLTAVPDD